MTYFFANKSWKIQTETYNTTPSSITTCLKFDFIFQINLQFNQFFLQNFWWNEAVTYSQRLERKSFDNPPTPLPSPMIFILIRPWYLFFLNFLLLIYVLYFFKHILKSRDNLGFKKKNYKRVFINPELLIHFRGNYFSKLWLLY